MTSLLSVRGLARRPFFEARSLEVAAGEIVALSGPSGSGKTLFLRAVADLDPSEAGEVRLDGRARDAEPPEAWRARVLYVHQRSVRLAGTVGENWQAVARLKAQEPAPWGDEVPPDFDPAADAERLSGGEAQAFALERALACRPRVLLLDESTSAMDPALAARYESRIQAFAAEGGGVLWVAHDRTLAARVGARAEVFA